MVGRWHPRWGIVFVRGRSMEPTFAGFRRFPIVAWGRAPRIGDVVIAERPDRPGMRVVKRATGHDAAGWWLESDAHEKAPRGGAGIVFSDSWLFGPVPDAAILGVVVWPDVRPRPRP